MLRMTARLTVVCGDFRSRLFSPFGGLPPYVDIKDQFWFEVSYTFKMYGIATLAALLVLCSITQASLEYSHHFDAIPEDVLMTKNRIFVTMNESMVILNRNLSVIGKLYFESNISFWPLDVSESARLWILICYKNGNCSLASYYNDVIIQKIISNQNTNYNKFSLSAILTGGNDKAIYIGGVIRKSKTGMSKSMELVQAKIDNSMSSPTKWSFTPMQLLSINSENFEAREYLYTFHHGDYHYFVVKDKLIMPMRTIIKIVRREKNPPRKMLPTSRNYEITLQTKMTNPKFKDVIYLVIQGMLFLGQTDNKTLIVHSYPLNKVDEELDATMEKCSHGDYEFYTSWSQKRISCSKLNQKVKQEDTVASDEALMAANHFTINSSNSVISAAAVEATAPTHFSIYVAFDSIQPVINQYIVSIDYMMAVLQRTVEVPDAILHIKPASDVLYVATRDQVMVLPADQCAQYNTCAACVSEARASGCGWCVSTRKCSSQGHCNDAISSQIPWIHHGDSFQCLASVQSTFYTLVQRLAAHDLHHPVMLLSGSEPLFIPEKCQILCEAKRLGISVKGHIFNSAIYCDFSTSSSLAAALPQHAEISADFEISISTGNNVVNLNAGRVTFYNCSVYSDCGACVMTEGCGWCSYQGMCTAANATCTDSGKWRQNQQLRATSSCAVLLPSPKGHYAFPVGVAVNVSLATKNLMPPIQGQQYVCKLHSNSGKTLLVPALYNSSTQALCRIKPNQVVVSRDSKELGKEHFGVTLWLVNRAEGREVQIEYQLPAPGRTKRNVAPLTFPELSRYPRLSALNCAQYSDSCSLCIAANAEAMNTCGWCILGNISMCTSLQQCTDSSATNTYINSSIHCYNYPVIRSVVPSSGPNVGGTLVTIMGSDLGVQAQDITVKLGEAICTVNTLSYLPAIQFTCLTTSSSMIGLVNISISVRRPGVFHAVFAAGVSNQFLYARPSVTGVWPTHGPLSGGTLLHVVGSALNISDTKLTTVTVAGAHCDIIEITYHMISCELLRSEVVTSGDVIVSINPATIPAPQVFSFVDNPQYLQLTPQHTIPSGGVTLHFHGNHLNASAAPRLVIYVEEESFSNPCEVASNQLLLCTAPQLTSLMSATSTTSLDYTIYMDGAPGPDTGGQALSLTLRPNPVLHGMAENSTTYLVFSGTALSIEGDNLESVQKSEIKITLLDENCSITVISSTLVQCIPPDFPIRKDRSIEVKVTIGRGALVYNVGSVLYVPTSRTSTSTVTPGKPLLSGIWVVVIAVSIVGVCIIVLLVGLIFVVGSIAARRRNRIFRVTHQDEPPDPRIESCLDKSTNSVNWYEVVPDHPLPPENGSLHYPANRNLVNQMLQPSHSNPSRLVAMAHERDSRSSQRLMTASPNHRSIPSLFNESRSCSVGRQSYSGRLHGDHINVNNNEEYVRMSSHLVASNLSISTTALDRHPNTAKAEQEDEDEESDDDTSGNAEYVDMQAPEQGSKYSISADSPPLSFHTNLETIV